MRERLVDVGVELVLAHGPVGLREIARRAGVSHGAPRRYFPTHHALLSAIAERGYQELGRRFATAQATTTTTTTTDDPRAQLAAYARVYVGYALECRGMFELMFRHDLLGGGQLASGLTPLRESTLPLFEQLVRLVQRCGVTEAPATAAALWSAMHGIAQLWTWGSLQLVLGGTGSQRLDQHLDQHLDQRLDQLVETVLAAHLTPEPGGTIP
ncbi:TetR family transcriptional regulator [Streptomyces tateyamensis]|uniref:TetR family transcriptional regulator n=1 Tax=Streptomyces tateyamensis TaxID=565073 RepID=A0A2V4N266_9ACTN|nr:TetR family transcriptional regulator [Streptomyces tateyamensis]